MKTPVLTLWAGALLVMGATAQAETVTRTIELDGIQHIYLAGQHQLIVTLGEREFVTLEVDEDYLDKIEAKVKGDSLALGGDHSWRWWDDKPRGKFTVQVKQLESISNRGSNEIQVDTWSSDEDLEIVNRGSGEIILGRVTGEDIEIQQRGSGRVSLDSVRGEEVDISLRGSGDLVLNELNTEETDIQVRGSGDVKIAKGTTEELDITGYGSGDINTQGLVAQETEVGIYGSGDVELHGANSLEVRIHDSGDVTYREEPTKLETFLHGSGTVKRN